MLCDQRLRRLHRPFDHAAKRDALPAKPDPAGTDAGDFQQVVDPVRHLSDLALDDTAGLLLDRVVILLQAQQHQSVGDRRRRVAKFVAEHGEELILAARQVGQRLCLFQGLALQPVARCDVLENDRDATKRFGFQPENVELEHPIGGCEVAFEADRHAGSDDRVVCCEPVLGDARRHLSDGLADHVAQAGLNLEGRIGFEVAKIQWRALLALHLLDDAKALVDRVEQRAIALLALAQLGLRAQAFQLAPDARGQLARQLDLIVAPVAELGVVEAEREAPSAALEKRHAEERSNLQRGEFLEVGDGIGSGVAHDDDFAESCQPDELRVDLVCKPMHASNAGHVGAVPFVRDHNLVHGLVDLDERTKREVQMYGQLRSSMSRARRPARGEVATVPRPHCAFTTWCQHRS